MNNSPSPFCKVITSVARDECMAYQHDTEFHDEDLPKASPFPGGVSVVSLGGKSPVVDAAPSTEDLTAEVTDKAQQLVALRERQAQIERAKAELEELRRRRAEFDSGRNEMRDRLIRSIALLEQSELAARRDAEQLKKSLTGLRAVNASVQDLNEKAWNADTWHRDLSRDLAILENARNELNSATLTWPVLTGSEAGDPAKRSSTRPNLESLTFLQLARLGLALLWPLLLLAMLGFGFLTFLVLRK